MDNRANNKANKKRFELPVWAAYIINLGLFIAFISLFGVLLSSGALPGFITKVAMLIGIQVILAVSLNVSTGYLGQLPLGHAGFMAVGAYASAIFMTHTSIPAGIAFPIGIVIAAAVAGLFGVLIGIPALRLKGDYLAIITLGFGEIIRVVLLNIDSVLGFKLTNGAAGLQNIPKTTTFVNAWLMVGLTCFLIHTFIKSRHGRAVLSIRENEIAAEACGINITYYKTLAFSMSDNQELFAKQMAAAGAVTYLGDIRNQEVLAELEKNVASWLSEHGAAEARKRSAGEALLLRQQESARMHALTDGLGSRRIAEKLIQISDRGCSGRKDRQQ